MRAEIGEPGHEHRETIARPPPRPRPAASPRSVALPDTNPGVDDPALVASAARTRQRLAAYLLPMAPSTKGCQGAELAEYGLLHEAGASTSPTPRPIANTHTLRPRSPTPGASAARRSQPADPSLSAGAAATSGELAARLGLPGVHATAETIMLARDLALARVTGAR